MPKALRIAFVSAFPPGLRSLNEYGFHFAKALAEHEDVAEVIILGDLLTEPAAELDMGPRVSVQRVWDFNRLSTPLKILRALRRIKPDAVIYNLQTATFGDREVPAALGLMTPMLSRFAGTKSGIIGHNIVAGIDLENTVLRGQRVRQMIVKIGGAVITRAMTMASYMSVTLRSYADILAKRTPRADVTLVPHGTFDTGQRDWIALGDRPQRIVTMGKFGTYKKLETLLAAFDILRKEPGMDKVELVIGGTDHPNTAGYVAGIAKARKDDKNVVFAGYIAEEDVPGFFEGARLAVFDYESTTGSSGVLHQAASFGTVPVFPRIGDFVDLCEDEGLTGGNFKPGDASDLAAKMAELLSDMDAADRIARQNRSAVDAVPMSDIVTWHIAKITNRPDLAPVFD